MENTLALSGDGGTTVTASSGLVVSEFKQICPRAC